ncbi:MAG: hypothetical protein ACR2NP_08925 [Pirellulaceae bacterium]
MCVRLYCVFALTICLVLTGPAAAWQEASEPPYTISPETTHFTGPQRESGELDFLNIINQRLGDAVTTENNAAIVLIPILGMEGLDPIPYLRRAGAGPPWPEWRPMTSFDWNITDSFNSATRRYWQPDDYPELFEWVESNNYARETIHAAAKRQYYHVALQVSDSELVASCLLPHVQCVRNTGRWLQVHATLMLGEDNLDECLDDIQALRGLSNQLLNGDCLVVALVGMALHDQACDAMAAVASSPIELMAAEWQTLEREWGVRKRLIEPDVIFVCDRALVLDAVAWTARNRSMNEVLKFFGEDLGLNDLQARLLESKIRSIRDWDPVIRSINQLFNDNDTAWRIDDDAGRTRALAEVNKTSRQRREQLESQTASAANLALASATDLATAAISLLCVDLTKINQRELRCLNEHRIVGLALAIRRYRQNHGDFPELLTDLPNVSESTSHLDLFSGQPYEYEVTDEGFILYSRGSDVESNGTDPSRLLNRNDTDDWGIVFHESD